MRIIRIYGIRQNGFDEESITHYKASIDGGFEKVYPKSELVSMLRNNFYTAYVADTSTRVEVVDSRYLRSDRNSSTRDNLLNLPSC